MRLRTRAERRRTIDLFLSAHLVRVGDQRRYATKLSLQIQPGEHAPSDID